MKLLMSDSPAVFIAGTMQGSRRGAAQLTQGYREAIRHLVLTHFPKANVLCPEQYMQQHLASDEEAIRNDHAALASFVDIDATALSRPLQKLTGIFHELVDAAAASDMCIAWLPDHEASMGTAVEMYAAWRAGVPVIAVTEMRQNLAILSCASLILPDLVSLGGYLLKEAMHHEHHITAPL